MRPGQDGLPWPQDPHLDREHRAPDPRPAGGAGSRRAVRPGGHPGGRCCHVRDARRGQGHLRIPVRELRHAQSVDPRAAATDPGPDGSHFAVPPRTDAVHGPVHRGQGGTEAGDLSVAGARADPGGDLRRHHLPGAGDEDRPGGRGLLPGTSGHPAPGDGQEEAQGDGGAAGALHQRRPRQGPLQKPGRGPVRDVGTVRGVRLSQAARGRLLGALLPDGLPQGALSGRVHGGQPDQRDGRHRQAGRIHRRGARHGPGGAAAQRQPVGGPLFGGGGQDRIRPAGNQERGRRRGSRDRGPARRGW